jgi:hypothetical protein
MEFLTFEPGDYQVLEDLEFDETIQRDERIRFFTLEEQTVDAFEQMVPRGRTTRYQLEQIQKTVDRYNELYTTFVIPTAERYNIREPTYAKSFDWVYPIYSSSGFTPYSYDSWASLFRDPTLPNIYPRMLAALPRPFASAQGTPYAFTKTTEFLDDQGRNPRRALPTYEYTRSQVHEDKTVDVVRVPATGTDDVVSFKGYYLAARTLDVPNPLDDHAFLKSNQASTIETTAPLSEIVPSLDAIITHAVPATPHPYREAVPYLNLFGVELADIPWSSWKSRFPPVEVVSTTPALEEIPYPKMDAPKPSEKLETAYRSPYASGMGSRYWLMNQVDGGGLVAQMLLSQSIDNGSVEMMATTGLNPASYPPTTLDDPACNLVGNTFGDFVVKGLIRRKSEKDIATYTCVPLEFIQQERKQLGYTKRLPWKESTGSDLLKAHLKSMATFVYPKEPTAKATGETKTPAAPDSLRRKEVLAIQSDPHRFVADRLKDIQELLKETTLTKHIYSDPEGAFVICEHTLAIMNNDLRNDRLTYYATWTVIDGGFRVCRFCGERVNADVTLNQDEYDENGFKIVQSEALGAVVATTDAVASAAGFADDFAGLRGLFQENSAIDSTVHMLLSILHVLPNPAVLNSLLTMGRAKAGNPADQRPDILKLRGTIGIALMVLLFHLNLPRLVPRRSFGSTPFKLTGFPRDSDTPESFTTTDSVLLAIRKTFEAFPTTLKGPSVPIIRETLAHTKKVRDDVHKIIKVFLNSKNAELDQAMTEARAEARAAPVVSTEGLVMPFIQSIAPPPAEAMNTLRQFVPCPTRRAIYASERVPPVRQAEVRLDPRITASPFRVDVSPSPSARVVPAKVPKNEIRAQLTTRVDSALTTTFLKVNVHTNALIASRLGDAFRVQVSTRSVDPTQNAAEQRDLAQGLLRTVLASVQSDETKRTELLKMASRDVTLFMSLADYKTEQANVNKLRATERLTFVDRMSKKNDQERDTVRELLQIGLAPYIITTQDRGLFAQEAETLQDQIARDRRRLEEFLDEDAGDAEVGVGRPRDVDDQDDPPPGGADNGDYGDNAGLPEGRDQQQPQIYDDGEEGV